MGIALGRAATAPCTRNPEVGSLRRIAALFAALAVTASLTGCGDDPSTGAGTLAPEPAPSSSARTFAQDGGTAVGASVRTYEVTLENLTPATGPGASQVFSPPVLASHDPALRLFRVGRPASGELAQLAEDAVSQPMLDRLADSDLVHQSFAGGGVIPPGQSATYEIEAAAGADRLSAVFMLVNTNDAFGGADALRLPERGEETVYLGAYDAGSEANTELQAHIPGPCCGSPMVRVPTEEPVTPHAGIRGVGDLDPATYGWTGPVARLTVRRIR